MLWGTGSPRREFLYSEDMADATIFLANLPADTFSSLLTPDSAPLINIGCGKDQTIQELAALVKEVVGFQGELTFDSRQPDGTPANCWVLIASPDLAGSHASPWLMASSRAMRTTRQAQEGRFKR